MENTRTVNFKKFLKPLLVVIIILLVLFGVKQLLDQKGSGGTGSQALSGKKEVKSQKIAINQSFDLVIPNAKADVKPLKVTFVSATFTNRILISNKAKYSTDKSRFLMLNLLMENPNTQRINLKTQDLIRLVDTNDKKFPPRYFNKNVAVEADAVKKDTVGFLVPENIKVFKIQYGLPTSTDKKTLELKFQ